MINNKDDYIDSILAGFEPLGESDKAKFAEFIRTKLGKALIGSLLQHGLAQLTKLATLDLTTPEGIEEAKKAQAVNFGINQSIDLILDDLTNEQESVPYDEPQSSY